MAFCNRFGSLIRQTISQNSASNGQVPMASMLNAIRCMSSSKLFIGGLSYGTDDESLRNAFSGFGDVVDAKVITDRDTGKSRGFGFVNFSSDESATSALSAMDGQSLNGRNIRVTYANDRPSAPRGNFGGGYNSGSGGYRGGFGDARENDGF
ncbi:Ribosome-interacting GTPase 2 [Sarracenia purpurea var. burkii]